MAHHKRRRPINRRAGCKLCKPSKINGTKYEDRLGHTGFGKLRASIHSKLDLKEYYGSSS